RGRQADRLGGGLGVPHRGGVVVDVEGEVVGAAVEGRRGGFAGVVAHLGGSGCDGVLERGGDRRGELLGVAARLAVEADVVGDDVGGVTRSAAAAAAEHADVAHAAAVRLVDAAEPAAAGGFGDRDGGGEDRGDA